MNSGASGVVQLGGQFPSFTTNILQSDNALLAKLVAGQSNAVTFTGMTTNVLGGDFPSFTTNILQANNDVLWKILAGVTNLPPPVTNIQDLAAENSLVSIRTNIQDLMNSSNADIATETTQVGISNLLSRMATNGLVMPTNYATESTLAGMSNLIGGNWSNSVPTDDMGVSNAYLSAAFGYDTNLSLTNFSVTVSNETSYAQAEGDSYAASPDLQGVETGLAGFLVQMSPVTVDDSWGEPDMTFDFGPYLGQTVGKMMGAKAVNAGSTVMDFNPMHNADLAAVFNAAKSLFAWIIAIIYLLKCATDAGKAIEMCEMARGVVVSSPTTKKTYT